MTSWNVKRIWSAQHAKARFGELLDACLSDGPQLLTRHGQKAAVLVSVDCWEQMQTAASPTLKELLLGDHARTDTLVSPRAKARRRPAQPQ